MAVHQLFYCEHVWLFYSRYIVTVGLVTHVYSCVFLSSLDEVHLLHSCILKSATLIYCPWCTILT